MGEDLAEGRQVHLDGIGYFRPTLTCTEQVTAATKRKTTKVKLKSIRFRAGRTLRSEIGNIKVKTLNLNEHSSKLSIAEIDRRLTDYFSIHPFLTRNDFQNLCSMMRSTAMRHIRRLRSEGKLKNMGTMLHPVYVPMPGHYGVAEVITPE